MDDFSRYDQYDISENDPYLIENSECLINLLGITNTSELNEAESAISALVMADLEITPILATFNLKHLQNIHSSLFSDIYPFAGKLRVVEIAKGEHLFLPHNLIFEKANEVFASLKADGYLTDLPADVFAEKVGWYFNQVNMIHSFREGNGRTQRIFFDQLAAANGYAFNWSSISQAAMGLVCREGRTIDIEGKGLSRLLALNIVRIKS